MPLLYPQHFSTGSALLPLLYPHHFSTGSALLPLLYPQHFFTRSAQLSLLYPQHFSTGSALLPLLYPQHFSTGSALLPPTLFSPVQLLLESRLGSLSPCPIRSYLCNDFVFAKPEVPSRPHFEASSLHCGRFEGRGGGGAVS